MSAQLKTVEVDPDHQIIERLELMLEQARDGSLRALGLAGVLQDGTIQTFIVNEGVNYFTMLGALTRLQLRYHNTVLDE